MNKQDTVRALIKNVPLDSLMSASAFAPINIALVKYWGKRDSELNLPITSSLSVSLHIGTHTHLERHTVDALILNGKELPLESLFATRLFEFIDLFRPKNMPIRVTTKNDIPTSAGLASSASGFAALTLCINDFFSLHLQPKELSILARLGSGSSSRSIFSGFVEWHKGENPDGLDSFAEPLNTSWDDLSLGLWIVSDKEKAIDSRKAMLETVKTSHLYGAWPGQVTRDLALIKKAIYTKDFTLLGQTAEQNALAMHATMLASSPSIMYFFPETIEAMHTIWQLRKEGLEVYFTMDAGPNIKLLSLKKDRASIACRLPKVQFADGY